MRQPGPDLLLRIRQTVSHDGIGQGLLLNAVELLRAMYLEGQRLSLLARLILVIILVDFS